MQNLEKSVSAVVQVTIDEDGKLEALVINTREDLLHDFQYFLSQAQASSAEISEAMFIHRRFLRASFLTLFAYAEAVVNGWVLSLLPTRPTQILSKRPLYDSLDKKIDYLHEVSTKSVAKPEFAEAKKFRNLFVHFTPTLVGELAAFETISLKTIEMAAQELEQWMSGIESTLNLTRHADSNELADSFQELGEVTKSISSDPRI